MDPGMLLMLFGLFSAWACIYCCIRFWRNYCRKWDFADKTGLILLVWGGGLLSAAGYAWSVYKGNPGNNLFIVDPTQGWWFLNWGRNLVLPLESFYHFLFIAMIAAIYNKKNTSAIIFLALLALSHPFTGLLAILIFGLWAAYERFYVNNKYISIYLIILPGVMLVAHLLYYLVYLPSIPSHQEVFRQWKLNWDLSAVSFILANILIAPPALIVLFKKKQRHIDLTFRHLILIWIVISLLLSFNNLFTDGYQPLHFTRGYLWLALYLAAYPWIRSFLLKIRQVKKPYGLIMIILLIMIALSDNSSWFIDNWRNEFKGTQLQMDREQKQILGYLSEKGKNTDLLISDDYRLGYYAIVYTPVRSLYSHWANTPAALEKVALFNRFRLEGKMDKSWGNQRILYLRNTEQTMTSSLSDCLSAHFIPVDSCDSRVLYCQKK